MGKSSKMDKFGVTKFAKAKNKFAKGNDKDKVRHKSTKVNLENDFE